jgi:hypothetical protein
MNFRGGQGTTGGDASRDGHEASSGGTGLEIDVNVKKRTLKRNAHMLFYAQLENIVRDVNAIGTRLRTLMVTSSALVSYAVTLLFHDFESSSRDQIIMIVVLGVLLALGVIASGIWWSLRPKSPMQALNERLAEYSVGNVAVGGTAGTGTTTHPKQNRGES